MKVFSNTTPLLAFSALGKFDLLGHLFGIINVVQSVSDECAYGGKILVPDLKCIPWMNIVEDPVELDPRFYTLDAGESNTISMAIQTGADIIIIDERQGRNLAEFYGAKVVGTLGVLLKAKKDGLIESFSDEVELLKRAGFWYDEKLVERLAKL